MKNRRLTLGLFALMGTLIFTGCEKDDPEPTQSIVEIVQDRSDLSSLVAALTKVLQHYIISSPTTATGRVFSRDLITGSVPTLNGNININAAAGTVTSGNGTVANNSTNATLVSVLGTNGVIHKINKVLVPSGK